MSTEDTKNPKVFKEEDDKNIGDEKSSLGMEPNVAGLLCYLLGFFSGIILYLLEKESRFVKFHAMQSIVMSVALFVIFFILSFIPIIGWIISILAAPLSFVLWIFMMVKAYQGSWYKLPWVGDFAEQQVDKS